MKAGLKSLYTRMVESLASKKWDGETATPGRKRWRDQEWSRLNWSAAIIRSSASAVRLAACLLACSTSCVFLRPSRG